MTHLEPAAIDLARAGEQWSAYVEVFRGLRWDIRTIDGIDQCPDAVFIEDTAVVFGDLAVTTRPGAPSRVAEVEGVRAPLLDCDLEVVDLAGGRLDGGDVLKVGRRVWVGLGGRTSTAGIAALEELLVPRGWDVRAVPISKVLHLKSAVTALPDGTIIGYPPLLDDESIFETFLPVPEEAGSHVVITGPDRLLLSASAPQTASLLRSKGYIIDVVDISEFEKLEGCVTCLSIRVR